MSGIWAWRVAAVATASVLIWRTAVLSGEARRAHRAALDAASASANGPSAPQVGAYAVSFLSASPGEGGSVRASMKPSEASRRLSADAASGRYRYLMIGGAAYAPVGGGSEAGTPWVELAAPAAGLGLPPLCAAATAPPAMADLGGGGPGAYVLGM